MLIRFFCAPLRLLRCTARTAFAAGALAGAAGGLGLAALARAAAERRSAGPPR